MVEILCLVGVFCLSEKRRKEKLIEKSKSIYVFEYIGRYKIGVTKNVYKRLSQLSCGCPGIKCLYTSDAIFNPYEVEKILHRFFSKDNIGGEWFTDVELSLVDDIVSKHARNEVIENTKSKNAKNMINILFPYDCEKEQNELNKMARENDELEKFLQCLNGADVPNQYSDLVYSILFGDNTVSLRKKYRAGRFESFRKYLTLEQNEKIDNYFFITVGLINSYADFYSIRNFLENL